MVESLGVVCAFLVGPVMFTLLTTGGALSQRQAGEAGAAGMRDVAAIHRLTGAVYGVGAALAAMLHVVVYALLFR